MASGVASKKLHVVILRGSEQRRGQVKAAGPQLQCAEGADRDLELR